MFKFVRFVWYLVVIWFVLSALGRALNSQAGITGLVALIGLIAVIVALESRKR